MIRVRLIPEGEEMSFSDAFALRLIEQGMAERAEEETDARTEEAAATEKEPEEEIPAEEPEKAEKAEDTAGNGKSRKKR